MGKSQFKKYGKKTLILVLFGAQMVAFSPLTQAQQTEDFNPDSIISDIELLDKDSLSIGAIQNFLESRAGTLSEYRTRDIDGVVRFAAEMIWRASQNYGISPKFLLVMLQKEQSLIEDQNPQEKDYDWAMGYGVCDSCAKDDPGIQKFKGFARQVDSAAWRNRYYYTFPEKFGIQVDQEHLIDGLAVTPLNQATANLYIYTPHLRGNENFFAIWNDYFGRSFPDGTLLRNTDSGEVYLIQDQKIRAFLSLATLYTDHNPRNIVDVVTSDLGGFDIGVPIKFPAFSLLQSPTGTVYLLADNMLRGLSSPEVFRELGYNPEEVIAVTHEDIGLYPEGAPLTTTSTNPAGALLQNQETGAVFFVKDEARHPITDRFILQHRFVGHTIKPVAPSVLSAISEGTAIGFEDGTLVKEESLADVYVIANGDKRAIVSEAVFLNYGYSWKNILIVPDELLNLHLNGDPLS